MVGQRKILNPFTAQTGQFDFPSWIDDQISKKNENKIEDAAENEQELVRKMSILAMWCIQMKPSDRPSMDKVIEMLEGDTEVLVMPPNSMIYSREVPVHNQELNQISTELII